MKDTPVAGRYARAFMIVTEKRGETEAALADLKGMGEVLKHGSRVGTFLTTPGIRLADKREALKAALQNRVLPSVLLFLDLLLRKKRLDHFADTVTEFEALVEKKQGIQRAHVTSAEPLAEAEAQRLLAALEARTGSKIRLTRGVDSALIGGAHVRIGDRVIDRSVRTLLTTIEQMLHEVAV